MTGHQGLEGGGPVTPKYGGRDGVNPSLLHPLGDVRQIISQSVVHIGWDIPDVECTTPKLEECSGSQKSADNCEFLDA